MIESEIESCFDGGYIRKIYENHIEIFEEHHFINGMILIERKLKMVEPLSGHALQMALDIYGYENIGDVPDNKLDEVYQLAVDLDD